MPAAPPKQQKRFRMSELKHFPKSIPPSFRIVSAWCGAVRRAVLGLAQPGGANANRYQPLRRSHAKRSGCHHGRRGRN